MKDQEFVALLNLFIDREISAEDAVRLEAEVRRDPARRALYTQYCRMHRACVAHAEAQAAAAPEPGGVVSKPFVFTSHPSNQVSVEECQCGITI